jgi:hypothetical protein
MQLGAVPTTKQTSKWSMLWEHKRKHLCCLHLLQYTHMMQSTAKHLADIMFILLTILCKQIQICWRDLCPFSPLQENSKQCNYITNTVHAEDVQVTCQCITEIYPIQFITIIKKSRYWILPSDSPYLYNLFI